MTGTISADRVDISSLKVGTIYGTGAYATYKLLTTQNANIYVGGEPSAAKASSVCITAISDVRIGDTATGAVMYEATTDSFRPASARGAILGTTGAPWGDAYLGAAYSTSYYWKISNACITPSTTASSTYFMIGSSSYPITALYVKTIYLNGTQLGTGSDSSSTSFAGKNVTMGGSTSYYIVCNTSRELRPYSSSTTYPCYLGTSSYYWHYAYIGSNSTYIGNSSSSKLGFFGTTPVIRQTVSSSATVATLITALKAYGLIG